MTEADYLIFLGRLENQSTRVPTTFSRLFQRYPIVFLGFPMDMWHYRLVGQVFQSIGVAKSGSNNVAVRIQHRRWKSVPGAAWASPVADGSQRVCPKKYETIP